ncbi:hypothetical protein GALMADRAFT_237340 [Galerina marginata CBS 339.88]|uniref:C2H2-type domain-containing protein n=1 Tax=Galerina marginata (strain CBS 339.88) TaxID=685588 RepID=A0A067TMV7_GALM3|nr:hypothetical protein GALMADRAFT_237340 [Galerina marginata CBS 339.88]
MSTPSPNLTPSSSIDPKSFVPIRSAEFHSSLYSDSSEDLPSSPSSRQAKSPATFSVSPGLSSTLPVYSDPNARLYVCGRPQCWPHTQPTSSYCFQTAGELMDHSRDQHPNEDLAKRPYRCALPGCGKSYKSIKRLQHHLQVSSAHFKAEGFVVSARQPEYLIPDGKYTCPLPGCFKSYFGPGSLRHHVKHIHSQDLPA